MQASLALPTPPRLPPIGLQPPAGDPVGALRRLVARYTLHGAASAILPPLPWREALAELAALHAEWQAGGHHPIPGPRGVVLSQLYRLELFHEGVCPRTGGVIVPLALLDQARRVTAHLPATTGHDGVYGAELEYEPAPAQEP